jgi:hypothetical protein
MRRPPRPRISPTSAPTATLRMTDADKETNRRKSGVRAKVEHSFLSLKCFWGLTKVRYRGLAKSANHARGDQHFSGLRAMRFRFALPFCFTFHPSQILSTGCSVFP